MPVNFCEKAEDERFYNKRCECYVRAKNKIKDGFEFLKKDGILIEQLSYVPYDFRNDKLKIVDKSIIKKKIGRSPDYADAFVLNFATLSNKLRETSIYTLRNFKSNNYKNKNNSCIGMCNILR